jgi:molecular chaperone GrpE (heat shock protein)
MKKNVQLLVLVSLAAVVIAFLIFYLFDSSTHQPAPPTVLIDNVSPFNGENIVMSNDNNVSLFNSGVIILILSLTTLCSISISFYLYKWRRILLANPDMVVPEKWAEVLMTLGKTVENNSKNVEQSLHRVVSETSKNTSDVKNMTETYMELQNALDMKDAELKRYRSGYDAYLYKKFIKRFIRIDQSLTDFMVDDESDNLGFIKRLFEDALDESGVSVFVPNVGEDYRNAIGIADNPKIELTDDVNLDFKIVEVIECGYQSDVSGITGIIVPSKVKIYKFKKEV